MALVNCPECGKANVSDTAESCPECGFSIKKHYEQIRRKEQREQEKVALEEKERIEYEKLLPELEQKIKDVDYNTKLREKPSLLNTIFRGQGSGLTWACIIVFILCFVLAIATGGNALFVVLIALDVLFGIFWFAIGYGDYKSFLHLYENQPSLDKLKNDKKEALRKEYKEIAHNLAVYGTRKAPEIKIPTYSSINNNTLKCPVCGSTNVKRISDLNRTVSVATLGLASSKIGKQYECGKCKHKW